jgi:hypothetical protein
MESDRAYRLLPSFREAPATEPGECHCEKKRVTSLFPAWRNCRRSLRRQYRRWSAPISIKRPAISSRVFWVEARTRWLKWSSRNSARPSGPSSPWSNLCCGRSCTSPPCVGFPSKYVEPEFVGRSKPLDSSRPSSIPYPAPSVGQPPHLRQESDRAIGSIPGWAAADRLSTISVTINLFITASFCQGRPSYLAQ